MHDIYSAKVLEESGGYVDVLQTTGPPVDHHGVTFSRHHCLQIPSGMFLSKISKIGQHLTKLSQIFITNSDVYSETV